MAQSTAGTNLATNWDDARVVPACRVYFDWNMDGDWGDVNENISSYVRGVTITHRLLDDAFGLPVLGGGRPSTATITLLNRAHYFSPEQTSTGLAATFTSVSNRKAYRVPVKIEMGYYDPINGNELLRQFTGQVESAVPREGPGRREMVYTCKGLDGLIERHTLSTDVQQDTAIDTIIGAHLTTAGITSQDLDKALTVLPYEWMDDDNLLSHLQNLAAADGGWLYWSKEGQARYERATHWLEGVAHLTAVATLTGAIATAQSHQTIWRNVYKSVVVRYARTAPGPLETVYESPEPIEIAPGATETVTCRFSKPITALVAPVEGDDYQPATPTGTDMAASCALTITNDAMQADLEFVNSHSYLSILIRGLTLRGYTLTTSEAQQVRKASTLTGGSELIDGEREFRMADNPWIMRREQAEFVASRMLNLLERPREIITWRGRLCPFLELGDRVTAQNTAQGLNEDCYVVGMKLTYGRSARMELELLPVANVTPHTGYFIIGTSNYSETSDEVYH